MGSANGDEEGMPRRIRAWFDTLLAAYGPQHWWPADTSTEVIIGAILTQNTAWTNVEKAIATLDRAGCLCFDRIHAMDEAELAELIRSAGTFRVKAKRLKAFTAWLYERKGGDLATAFEGPLPDVRRELLAVKGIGPETADAILLYAASRPTFVIDAYTKRLLRRHHVIDRSAKYDEAKRVFESALSPDTALFNEYHALIVEVGKKHCRAKANCEGCPLAEWPHDESL